MYSVRDRAGQLTTATVTIDVYLATVGARGVATRSARATVVIINPTPTFTG